MVYFCGPGRNTKAAASTIAKPTSACTFKDQEGRSCLAVPSTDSPTYLSPHFSCKVETPWGGRGAGWQDCRG